MFLSYKDSPIKEEGYYLWRSSLKTGQKIIFCGKTMDRHYNPSMPIFPDFCHWDGWKYIVPEDLEYKLWDGKTPTKYKLYPIIEIEGLKNAKCPFCHKIPKWNYYMRFVGSSPLHAKSFYLECCDYFNGELTRKEDPSIVTEKRNSALKIKNVY